MDEIEKNNRPFRRFGYTAYIREGNTYHTGEALLLAMLMHTKGGGRKSQDMSDVQKIMRDHNAQNKKKSA